MSIDLVRLGTMVQLVTPTAVELSVWIGFWGCGHPISVRFCRIVNISLSVRNNLSSYASLAEDIKYLIICAMVRMGTL